MVIVLALRKILESRIDAVTLEKICIIYLIVSISFAIIYTLLATVVQFKIFEKAHENGFKACIPFYHHYLGYKINWGYGWIFFLWFTPIGFILTAIDSIKMCKIFEKDSIKWYIVGILFKPIFLTIIAFDKSKYLGYEKGYLFNKFI